VVRAADLVVAGNAHLARLAQRVGAEPRVIPTCVEVGDGPPVPEPVPPPSVLGWIGSRSTLPYLERVTVPLAAVVAMGAPFRLRVVADAFPAMPPGIPVEEVRWTAEGEAAALDGIHVGLAPLPDDPWTRGKCGLKVIQCMARGRPVVASAVGVQAEQVRHGVTGMLATDDASFVESIVTLLKDGEARRRQGAAAREEVVKNWSVAAWRDRVVATLAEVLE
jgi:glycosyltransferase involved in cell wall biosynthesis